MRNEELTFDFAIFPHSPVFWVGHHCKLKGHSSKEAEVEAVLLTISNALDWAFSRVCIFSNALELVEDINGVEDSHILGILNVSDNFASICFNFVPRDHLVAKFHESCICRKWMGQYSTHYTTHEALPTILDTQKHLILINNTC